MAAASSVTENLLRGLECPICQDYFSEPRMLPCGHTLCLRPCLERVAGTSPSFSCPECRARHVVPNSGVQGFPVNVTVVRQLECRPQAEAGSPGDTCPLCGGGEDLSECGHCQLTLCHDCLQQHLQDVRALIVQLAQDTKEKFVDASVTEQMAVIKNSAEATLSKIDATTRKIIAQVQRKANQLKMQVSTTQRGLETSLKDAELQKYSTKVQDTADKALQLAADQAASPSDLAKISEQLRNESEQVSTEINNEVRTVDVSMDEQAILNVLDNFKITTGSVSIDAASKKDKKSSQATTSSSQTAESPGVPSVNIMYTALLQGARSRPLPGGREHARYRGSRPPPGTLDILRSRPPPVSSGTPGSQPPSSPNGEPSPHLYQYF